MFRVCFCSGAGALHRAVGLLENRFRFREEGLAARSESDFAMIAVKERDSEFIFELFDLAAERGLRDMEPGRSPGEIEFTGHGSEVAELPQFHDAPTIPIRHDCASKEVLAAARGKALERR